MEGPPLGIAPVAWSMDPAVLAGLVVLAAGRTRDATAILSRTDLDPAIVSAIEADDLPVSTRHDATAIDVKRDPDGRIVATRDGRPLRPGDLDLKALVAGVSHLAGARGDLEAITVERVADLVVEAEGSSRADRLRLLLEDYLLRPSERPVVVERLRQVAERDRRRDRDVDGLFEA